MIKKIFLFFNENICCDPSLEPSQRVGSNDGSQTGNKLEGDVGDIISLQAQMSPYFQLREKLKCIERIDKSETQLKTSP